MVYKLSATLKGHTQDVRAVASPTPDLILSASRDSTSIAWRRSDVNAPFAPSTPLQAGSRFVNAVTYLAPSGDAPQGSLVSAGQDTIINVFPLGSEKTEPSHSLIGHSENVCALDATPNGTIISGSWDSTARVWKNYSQVHELKGHAQAVWAVLAIDDDNFLTGSADKTIKLWAQHKLVRTFTGHTDAVRGLTRIPDIGFASCSNDSEIRVWTMEGDVIHTLSGHTSFVYSLALLPSGDIVSAGEDRSVRVWKDGECAQVIVHPAISVWTVSTMPNGDIVSGCSDSVVRVFSEREERWANADELKAYDDLVSSQSLPSQQVGDVQKDKLPGPEALNQPGRKEGQVLMVRGANGTVEAHQWSSAANSWQKIGEVVDAVGQGRKQLYNGKEYDHVFDVDVQEGVPPLKLPYNVDENPYAAAQRFLASNDLPPSYLDEVVQFIEKNAAGTGGGSAASASQFVDPFTGASSYRAGSSSGPTSAPSAVYQDPFTGSGGYHGSPAPAAPSSSSNTSFLDPFTGAGGYHGAGSVPAAPAPKPVSPPPASQAILPVRTPLAFKQSNIAAMRTKLYEIHNAFAAEPGMASEALLPEEQTALNRIFATITSAAAVSADPTKTKNVKLAKSDVDGVLAVAARWHTSVRFPVIDLARLISAYAPASVSTEPSFAESLLATSEWGADVKPVPKHMETNILLALRALSNLFQVRLDGEVVGIGPWNKKLFEELLRPSFDSLVKTQWVALATIVLNFSSLTIASPNVDEETRKLHLKLIHKILTSPNADVEGEYRALVALGNVVYATKGNPPTALSPSELSDVSNLATQVAQTHAGEERFGVVAKEIAALANDGARIG